MANIDRWVVREFIQYLADHPCELEALHMANLNLSGQTLSDPDFFALCAEVFASPSQGQQKALF